MQRTSNAPGRPGWRSATENHSAANQPRFPAAHRQVGIILGHARRSASFSRSVCAVAGYHFRPFSLSKELGQLAGFLFAIAVILFEVRLRKASLRRLIGAATGSILGILGAYLTSLILTHTTMPESTRSFFSLADFPGDDLHRPGAGREQGRHAEPAGVRRASSAANATRSIR